MGAPNRMVRVNEVIKRELAELLERETWNNLLVSVLEVSTAPDLRNAIVLISVFGGNENDRKKVLNHLHKIRPALQKKIAAKVILKYTPVLEFRIDDRTEAADWGISLLEGKSNDNEAQE